MQRYFSEPILDTPENRDAYVLYVAVGEEVTNVVSGQCPGLTCLISANTLQKLKLSYDQHETHD